MLPGLLAKGVYGYPFRGWWEDAGTPARLLHAQRLLFDHPRAGRFTPRAHLPGARVLPQVATGKECTGEGATVGRYATLGDRVRLGAGAIVEDSILLDDVEVGAGAHLQGCVVGPGFKVPPGEQVANRCLASEPPARP